MICEACGEENPLQQRYHALCQPDHEPFSETGETPFDMELKGDLLDVIRWAHNTTARSEQVALGCSEAGHPCERRVAMTMAGVQAVNFPDPWPSIVGTAVHTWMERAITRYEAAHGIADWLTELEIVPSQFLPGHCDLYHEEKRTVLDWKFPGETNFKKFRDEGWDHHDQYKTQLHLYGKGIKMSGRPVERVGLVVLRREGWLTNIIVKTAPFDETIADDAIARVMEIGKSLIAQDIPDSGAWAKVPASPDYMTCTFCPYFRGGTEEADSTGCPGK